MGVHLIIFLDVVFDFLYFRLRCASVKPLINTKKRKSCSHDFLDVFLVVQLLTKLRFTIRGCGFSTTCHHRV